MEFRVGADINLSDKFVLGQVALSKAGRQAGGRAVAKLDGRDPANTVVWGGNTSIQFGFHGEKEEERMCNFYCTTASSGPGEGGATIVRILRI